MCKYVALGVTVHVQFARNKYGCLINKKNLILNDVDIIKNETLELVCMKIKRMRENLPNL